MHRSNPTNPFLILSILILAMTLSTESRAQSVQWAVKLLDFSTEYSKTYASASQVLGPPNMYPGFGESGVAWAPSKEDGASEFVRVQFEEPIRVRQIAIAETLNPGTIEEIILYDIFGKKHSVYKSDQKGPGFYPGSRMFRKLIPLTNFRSRELKLVLRTAFMPGMNQIDAIAISDSDEPIDLEIPRIDDEGFEGEPENLGPYVNSPYDDMLPIISPDGKTLYFTRKSHPDNFGFEKRDDIYVSFLNSDGNWSPAKNIGPPLNNEYHNYVGAISPDGSRMLLANDYSRPGSGQKVSLSKRSAKGWSFPETLRVEDMYSNNEFSCYHMNVDGNVIVMAIEREETFGDMDLYVSKKKRDGSWTIPINMGADLNTAAREGSAFIAADGRSLYFSSEGLPGYGGFDMYVSKRLDDSWTRWSKPLNLGPKINTPDDDFYYTIPASGDYAYFSSRYDSYGGADLYRIKLPRDARPEPVAMIEGKVIDAISNEPIEAEIRYISLKDGKELGDANSNDDDGSYKIVLPYGDDYGVQVDVPGYFPISEHIDLDLADATDWMDYPEDDVEETVRRELRSEIREELQDQLADEVRDDLRQDLNEEVKRDLEKDLEDDVRRDLEDQLKYDVRLDLEKDLEEDVRKDLENELKYDVRRDLEKDLEEDVRKDLEDELKYDVKRDLQRELEDEVRDELRDQLRDDVSDELREQIKDNVEDELREEISRDVEQDLRKELEEEVRKELEEELRKEVQQKLKDEMRDQIARELREELRREMEDEIRREITAEMEEENKYQIVEQDIRMIPIKKGQIIPLNNIFFEANKAFLKKESVAELEKVVEFLKVNDNIKVEIAGHTNSLPSEIFCEELSTSRAKRVTEYLIENGVDKDQIEFKGYGKTQPVATNGTLEGRKQNQRVELRVLEIE